MNNEHAAYSTQVYILTDTSFNIHSYTNTQSNSVIPPWLVATKLQQRAYRNTILHTHTQSRIYNINGTRLSKTVLKISELQHCYVTFKHFCNTNFAGTPFCCFKTTSSSFPSM